MLVWRSFDEVRSPEGGTSVALGVFDGVHLGHRELLDSAVTAGRRLGAMPVMVTFDPHPMEVVRPGSSPAALTTLGRRTELAAAEGVDAVFVLPFDREIASWEPDEFVDRVLVRTLGARSVVVGTNFTFGRAAAGTPEVLRHLCADRGIECRVLDLVAEGGRPVSSTRVREHLGDGDVAAARELLGRDHRVVGEVVHGAGRGGRDLGYPTANLDVAPGTAVPGDGVYAGWFTLLPGGSATGPVDGTIEPGRRYPAAISVGTNPTFGGAERSVEAFVLDQTADLYGRMAAVDFHGHVRDMECFDSVDQLLVAMAADVRRTRELLAADD